MWPKVIDDEGIKQQQSSLASKINNKDRNNQVLYYSNPQHSNNTQEFTLQHTLHITENTINQNQKGHFFFFF